MTILYKLLGIPRTVDEFIDKVKRDGQSQVDIQIKVSDVVDIPSNYLCSYNY